MTGGVVALLVKSSDVEPAIEQWHPKAQAEALWVLCGSRVREER